MKVYLLLTRSKKTQNIYIEGVYSSKELAEADRREGAIPDLLERFDVLVEEYEVLE